MSSMWVKYTVVIAQEIEEEFGYTILESSYTLGWTEPQFDVILTDNGYDYATRIDKPYLGFVFEPLSDSDTVEEAVSRFRQFLSQWGEQAACIAHELVEEENESWKAEFQSVTVDDWIIAPSWTPEDELEQGKNILWIDPGAAFGTGYHGTTQDIMRFLQKMNLNHKRVLDIGAGSGILSILCAKLGAATPVYAVDINPEADWQINQNLQLNQLSPQTVEIIIGDPLSEVEPVLLPTEVDLVMVNIGGDEDVAMLPVVLQSLKPGGMAILSGMVTWNREMVEKAYRDAGFELLDEKTSDEWVTLVTRLCENKK